MNQDTVKGHWKEIKGKLKQQWGNLTDDDIARLNGSREELEGLLQQRYGYERDRIEKEIDNFLDKNRLNKDDTY
jgi:uncharacterized protein YjbJ (UPF0337 family)